MNVGCRFGIWHQLRSFLEIRLAAYAVAVSSRHSRLVQMKSIAMNALAESFCP
jgi:hypothetical protein